ncbi:MAG: T9SS type A sorting domain-containing protein, partial [FCB group bacterium]|nr:T9SS type A sorting domain-containing protein [FCB group bacterium]
SVMGEVTDPDGFAERTFNYGDSTTLIPQKSGLTFSPEQISIPLVNRDTCLYFGPAPVNCVPVADQFVLNPNYPNPFNPQTTLAYRVPELSEIRLCIYDIRGKYVCTLADKRHSAGDYRVNWHAAGQAGGIYIAVLYVNGKIHGTQKMILLK